MRILQLKEMPLEEIESSRDDFRLSWGRPTEALEESLKRKGCLQPLLALREEKPRLLDGFRRRETAQRAGLKSLPVNLVEIPGGDAEAFQAALELFLSSHTPNPMEQSVAICKLERYFDPADIQKRFLPSLGLNPSPVIYQRFRAMGNLPQHLQEGLAAGKIDSAAVPFLMRFAQDSRAKAGEVLLHLQPSKSAQKEILEHLHDVTMREEKPLEQLLKEEQPASILEHSTANLPQKREAFRRWLRFRRFPVLSRVEEDFSHIRKQLGLAGEVTLAPPPYFEGSRYEVRFNFQNMEQFKKRVESLVRAGEKADTLEALWK